MSHIRHAAPALLAIVPPHPQGGAASRYSFLSEELTAFVRRGVVVHSLSPFVTEPTERDGVVVHPIPRWRHVWKLLRSVQAVRHAERRREPQVGRLRDRVDLARWHAAAVRVIEQERIGLVYSPFATPKGTGAIPAARAAGIPAVISLRGVDVLIERSIGYGLNLDPAHRARISTALRQADQVVGVSRSLAEHAVALGAFRERVSVVLKGVEIDRFRPGDRERARRRLGLPSRPTVLFVGNLIPRKGVDVLIRAFALLRQRLPSVQLVICGDGPERGALETSAAGLGSAVTFRGRISRSTIPDYFRACDLFALPSLSEGSGNVLVEAGATARPVVATDIEGIPDYVVDGETGFLFRKGDAADFAEKAFFVLSDRELAERLGASARENVLEHHRYDQMIDHLLQVFHKVCPGGGWIERLSKPTTTMPELAVAGKDVP